VATALQVAGSTLTFWIPWQTPFASTSSYSSLYNCRRLTYGSFQLTHMSRDDHAVQLIKFEWSQAAKTKTKHYYSTHNLATRVSFGM